MAAGAVTWRRVQNSSGSRTSATPAPTANFCGPGQSASSVGSLPSRKFAPVCSICENPIIPRDGKDAFKIECMGRNFHENCYRCEVSGVVRSQDHAAGGPLLPPTQPCREPMGCQHCAGCRDMGTSWGRGSAAKCSPPSSRDR